MFVLDFFRSFCIKAKERKADRKNVKLIFLQMIDSKHFIKVSISMSINPNLKKCLQHVLDPLRLLHDFLPPIILTVEFLFHLLKF